MSSITDAINQKYGVSGGNISEAIQKMTSSVPEGSLTESKFSDDLKNKSIKDYVTPQMFGADGSGSGDDTAAFEQAVAHGYVFVPNGTYRVSTLNITNGIGNGSEDTYMLFTTSENAFPYGNRLSSLTCFDTVVTALADETVTVNLVVKPGVVYDNLTIYPMVRELGSGNNLFEKPSKQRYKLVADTFLTCINDRYFNLSSMGRMFTGGALSYKISDYIDISALPQQIETLAVSSDSASFCRIVIFPNGTINVTNPDTTKYYGYTVSWEI